MPALLFVFVVSTAILLAWASAGDRLLKLSPWRAVMLLMNAMMGYPVNDILLGQAATLGETEEEKGMLKRELGPVLGIGTSLISNGLSLLVVGILVLFL